MLKNIGIKLAAISCSISGLYYLYKAIKYYVNCSKLVKTDTIKTRIILLELGTMNSCILLGIIGVLCVLSGLLLFQCSGS